MIAEMGGKSGRLPSGFLLLLMEIILNGETLATTDGLTVLQLLESLAIDPAKVAIELDRCIVKSALWSTTPLAAGAKLEIVHFVGGG